jgi:hypothetical protein
VLLFITSVTSWEILLLGAKIDSWTRERRYTIEMFKVRYCLTITECAGSLNLLYGIGQLKETCGPLKELGSEIRAKSVADNRDVHINRKVPQLLDNGSAQELRLIDEDTTHPLKFLSIYLGIRQNFYISSLLNTCSRADHLRTETVIKRRLYQNHLFTLSAVVVRHGEKIERLSTTNGTVTEIEFGHARTPEDLIDGRLD